MHVSWRGDVAMADIRPLSPGFWLTLVSIMAVLPVTCSTRLMVILLDGFRWDYFNIHGMELRGFPKLFNIGTKAEYTTVDYPTLSYPNYYTLMTGLYDDIHGVVANYMYDSVKDEEFLVGRNPGYNQSFWWDGGDPLWITATRQKKTAHLYYWPNCEVIIRGLTPESCVPYNGVPTRREFINALTDGVTLFEKKQADFVGIYFEKTDKIGHKHGPRSSELRQVIRELDEDIYGLLADLERRHLQEEVDIIIVSDHGMTEVSPERVVRIEDYVNTNDVSRFMEWGPLLCIWPKDGKVEEVYNSLKNANEHMTVYMKENTPERWHYRKSSRISPIVVSMETGWYITQPAKPKMTSAGTHGYDNAEVDMRGIFVATGPSFKASFVSKPIHIVDVYQLMCRSLDIQPSPHNGTWSHVTHMWKSSQSSHFTASFYFFIFTAIVTIIYVFKLRLGNEYRLLTARLRRMFFKVYEHGQTYCV